MAINAIPGLFAVTAPEANTNTNVNTNAAQAAPAAAAAPTDTVQLTEAEQVYQLYNQGQQVPQIAEALSLSVAEVNIYLNITNTAA